ncbi:MAG: TldD/PmbA family protein [Rhodospirillales bacterium]|nr:TldD/PmbA family protein [Rhodospirillales bacterium]
MDPLDLAAKLVRLARAKGADAADAVWSESLSLSAQWRMGALEQLDRAETIEVGLRAFLGKRQAIVSTSDLSPAALDALAERAVAMAKTVPEDPWCGLADPDALCLGNPDLDLVDPQEPSPDSLIARARACEEAARAVEGITNSEGAQAGWSRSRMVIVGTNGMARLHASTGFSQSVAVVAGEGTAMERDYDHAVATHGSDLPAPELTGTRAGRRTVARLNPRKMPTQKVPVVFSPRKARSLIGHFAGAVNGAAVARGTSFLKDRLGTAVFAKGVTIIDDPLRPRGLRSHAADGEGIASRERALVEDGRLASWLLDLRSARQLGMESTGHAARGVSAPPGPGASNLFLMPGATPPETLIADIKTGFYVTDLFGMGTNMLTGDYSRGAAGFWIENGQIAFPVSEVTVAGNLKDMFQNLVPANDLSFLFGIDSPTVRIDGLTVAGA